MKDREFLKAIKGMSEFEWRTNESVLALIEKRQNEIKYLYDLKELCEITVPQQIRLNKLTKTFGNWLYFKIEEVDTSKKWVIYEYDSSTKIHYIELMNDEYNFYGFI